MNKNKAHVIPASQVKEFCRPGGPDYKTLIEDCLGIKKKTEIKVPVVKPKKKGWF